jgi:hypothetical protein
MYLKNYDKAIGYFLGSCSKASENAYYKKPACILAKKLSLNED